MKTMIRLALLVAILCAFTAPQASAQAYHPHPKVTANTSFPFGSLHPLSTPTGQGSYISIFVNDGRLDLPIGATKKEIAALVGGPFYVSILIKYGVIAFDSNGNMIRPPGMEDEPEETPKPEEAKTPPSGG